MPKIAYADTKLGQAKLDRIEQANQIIAEYAAQGFDLTLRQLYYQFVSRALIPNNDKEYKKLGDIISDGRMCGLIDWDAIVDRTRYLRAQAHWSSPASIVKACSTQFRLDKWERQDTYCEVWIEKDALIGVIENICNELDVPYLACRGYASISEVWRAGHQRLKEKCEDGKDVRIFYLGDHDPSGIDMSRDVQARLDLFVGEYNSITVDRLALNYDQIQQYNPPPNPTKLTDSRATGYIDQFGHTCWELDALEPTVIADLIQDAVLNVRDDSLWEEAVLEEKEGRTNLAAIADKWDSVITFLKGK